MSKAYSIVTYRSIDDPALFEQYARLAGPAITAAGGRFIARGLPVKTFEGVDGQRSVLIEFESAEAAQAAYLSDGYQEALRALGNGATRDYRIVEGC